MATIFCKSFTDEILTLYKNKNLYISLVTNDAEIGSSIINRSEVNEFIIPDTEKTIIQGDIEGTELTASNAVWEDATFDVRYAIVYDDDGLIIFFIDFESIKSINNSNFELDFSDGFIKIG